MQELECESTMVIYIPIEEGTSTYLSQSVKYYMNIHHQEVQEYDLQSKKRLKNAHELQKEGESREMIKRRQVGKDLLLIRLLQKESLVLN